MFTEWLITVSMLKLPTPRLACIFFVLFLIGPHLCSAVLLPPLSTPEPPSLAVEETELS